MDLERAMEFMVEQQARMQVRHEQMQERQAQMQAQMQEQQAQMQEQMREQQAAFQAQNAAFQAQHAAFQTEMAQLLQMDKAHEKRLDKLERLAIRGAKMLAKEREWRLESKETAEEHRQKIEEQRELGRETDRRISALVLAQQENEQGLERLRISVQAFIDALGKSSNGHSN